MRIPILVALALGLATAARAEAPDSTDAAPLPPRPRLAAPS